MMRTGKQLNVAKVTGMLFSCGGLSGEETEPRKTMAFWDRKYGSLE
jgi:hypothetical protein